jgi:uncharacterized protein with HEPN domain
VKSGDWQLRIEDILGSIAKIERYTLGMTAESFAANQMTIAAVARNIGIIGEAARHIPATVEARYPEIPWVKMRGMRNIVIHDYPGVDVGIVWDTVGNGLPPLVPVLREILEQEP